MQGLQDRLNKFNQQHQKTPDFGNLTLLEQYRYPLDAIVDGNIPVTVSHIGNITGSSTSQLCTDSEGVQTWVEIGAVKVLERNYLPGKTTQQLVGQNR